MSPLLQKAVLEAAYAKLGLSGFAGSGKTYTAILIALGLQKKIGSTKPIAFFDTEAGSDFVIGAVEEAGHELFSVKSRAFSDLAAVMKEAPKVSDILIIDSITHPWVELTESYMRKKNAKFMEFQHWKDVKATWQKDFATPYVNSPIHIIMCGRAGFEYSYETNDNGKKELVKTGTKMKAENEMGYEASLLIEMEREREDSKIGSGNRHIAHVLKDRSRCIDGKKFTNPTFAEFEPFFDFLNLGGKHRAVDADRTSDAMFDAPDSSYSEERRAIQIALEEMAGVFDALLPGHSNTKDGKAIKSMLLKLVLGTTSGKAMEKMEPFKLEKGVGAMEYVLRHIRDGEMPSDHAEVENVLAGIFSNYQDEQLRLAEVEAKKHEEGDLPMDIGKEKEAVAVNAGEDDTPF